MTDDANGLIPPAPRMDDKNPTLPVTWFTLAGVVIWALALLAGVGLGNEYATATGTGFAASEKFNASLAFTTWTTGFWAGLILMAFGTITKQIAAQHRGAAV